MEKKIVILGTGGNCIDILDTINEINRSRPKYRCMGFLDDEERTWGQRHHGIEVLGPLTSAPQYDGCWFVNGIGSPANFWRKQEIIAKTQVPDERFETIVHPSASVSSMAQLGRGTVVFQNVTITSNVQVGKHVIILPNSVVSHDDVVGDYTCIAAGACLSGGVSVGRSCYLGTQSCIIGGAQIGDYCLIGMGSVVLDRVPENSVMVGNPARFLRHTVAGREEGGS